MIQQAAEDAWMRRRTAETEPTTADGEGLAWTEQASMAPDHSPRFAYGDDGTGFGCVGGGCGGCSGNEGQWSLGEQQSPSTIGGWGERPWIASTAPPTREAAGAYWASQAGTSMHQGVCTQAPPPRFAPPSMPPALPVAGTIPGNGSWGCEQPQLTPMNGPCGAGPMRTMVPNQCGGMMMGGGMVPLGIVSGPIMTSPSNSAPGAVSWGNFGGCDVSKAMTQGPGGMINLGIVVGGLDGALQVPGVYGGC